MAEGTEETVIQKVHIKLIDGRRIEAEIVNEMNDGVMVKNAKDLVTLKTRKFQTYYNSEIVTYRKLSTGATLSENGTANENTNEMENRSTNGDTNGSSNVATNGSVNGSLIEIKNGNQNEINNTSQNRKRDQVENRAVSVNLQSISKKVFSDREITKIQNMIKNFDYIMQYDEKYHKAIEDLMDQDIIFINSESPFGRLDPVRPLLSLATCNKVYLFDMLRLGKMKKELKQVFSSDHLTKVTHSSAGFVDYLTHKEDCALNNIFDTLIVHFSLKKTRDHISIKELFVTYLELPDGFALEEFDFRIRPLSEESKYRASLRCALLMKLYFNFVNILHQPLKVASKDVSKTYQTVHHQVDLMTTMNNREYPGIENVNINGIDEMHAAFEDLQTY